MHCGPVPLPLGNLILAIHPRLPPSPTPASLPQKQKSQHSALYLNRYAFVSDDSWVAPGTGDGGEGRAGTADAGGGGVGDGQGASCAVDVYEPTPLGGRRGEAALRVHNTMILGDHVWFQEVSAPGPSIPSPKSKPERPRLMLSIGVLSRAL